MTGIKKFFENTQLLKCHQNNQTTKNRKASAFSCKMLILNINFQITERL